MVFLTPLYFGIAHINHLYEFKLANPFTPISAAIFRSVFQFTYTTIFGWLATFIYIRTGSLPAVILIHSFCNYCGLPRLWGRVEGYSRDGSYGVLGIGWTVAYYVLLVTGALLFYEQIWRLTESSGALATFV